MRLGSSRTVWGKHTFHTPKRTHVHTHTHRQEKSSLTHLRRFSPGNQRPDWHVMLTVAVGRPSVGRELLHQVQIGEKTTQLDSWAVSECFTEETFLFHRSVAHVGTVAVVVQNATEKCRNFNGSGKLPYWSCCVKTPWGVTAASLMKWTTVWHQARS